MPIPSTSALALLMQRLRGRAPRAGSAVTALALGPSCLAVRVERGTAGKPRITAALEGPPAALPLWRQDKLFAASQAVLVLRQEERQLLVLERPEVPDAELALALRFPLAEALEEEPDQIIAAAVKLPRISEAPRSQVLAAGAVRQVLQAKLALAAEAGIGLRSIDVIDSALRGMAALQSRQLNSGDDANGNKGQVVLAFIGRSIAIGLLWHGEFCALRSLPLPVREPREAAEFEEHLALHIQRTTDQFERQATQLAVRQVLAAMPSLHEDVRQSVRGSLPLTPTLFDAAEAFEIAPGLSETIRSHNDLHALACVAALHLLEAGATTDAPAQTIELFDRQSLTPRHDYSLAVAASVMAIGVGMIGAYGYSLQDQLRQLRARQAALATELKQVSAPKPALSPALLADLKRQVELLEAPLRSVQVGQRDDGAATLRASSWLERLATLASTEISLLKIEVERSGNARLEGLATSPAAVSSYVQALTRLDPAMPVQASAIEVRQDKTAATPLRFVMRVSAPQAPTASPPAAHTSTAAVRQPLQMAERKP